MKQLLLIALTAGTALATSRAEIEAGAAAVDVTPEKLPALVNGSMLGRSLDKVKTRVHARTNVVADRSMMR